LLSIRAWAIANLSRADKARWGRVGWAQPTLQVQFTLRVLFTEPKLKVTRKQAAIGSEKNAYQQPLIPSENSSM